MKISEKKRAFLLGVLVACIVYRKPWRDSSKQGSPVGVKDGKSRVCTNSPPVREDPSEFLCEDPAISHLKVLPDHPKPSQRRTRVLCLVLTTSPYHFTKMKAVLDTWGNKCDALIGASNLTDHNLRTYQIIDSTRDEYWRIYDKLLHSLQQILEPTSDLYHILPDFDWILKADDDTYVIMENMRYFLANLSLSDSEFDEPLVFGRVMAWPRLQRFKQTWFSKQWPNQEFGKRFYEKLDPMHTLRFCHGGPGYIMNRKYAQLMVDAYFNSSGNRLKGEIAEDMGGAATMLYHGVRPKSTFDFATERERMHPESPQTMFENPPWLVQMHRGIQSQLKEGGEGCCSPTSISFHYVADFQMRLLHHQIYKCPRGLQAQTNGDN